MEIKKSTRHPKIAGDFGEAMILYWLSKHGFECAKVDHTGIDLIANNPHTKEVMGISVKSRTRSPDTEEEFVKIDATNFQKMKDACNAFGCRPYFAIVVDANPTIRIFITSMEHVLDMYPIKKANSGWRMSPNALTAYANDDKIMSFELEIKPGNWWKPSKLPPVPLPKRLQL